LKPANLMVDAAGVCWIIDFGLACYLNEEANLCPVRGGEGAGGDRLTVPGMLGTPEYMAPGQLKGKADVRSDGWGLGVTRYELLTLRRPFAADTRPELMKKIESEAPMPPSALVGNLPRDLAAVCLKALEKKPEGRYATAEEMAADLRRWLAGEPTKAR